MKSNCFIFACVVLLGLQFTTQISAHQDPEDKRSLEHADYELWSDVKGQKLSNDGKWTSYTIAPASGDSTLRIREIDSNKEYSVRLGSRLRFSFDSEFALFTVAPDPERLKQLRETELTESELPRPRLVILQLQTGRRVTISGVKKFSMPAEASGWVAGKIDHVEEEPTVQESTTNLNNTYQITPTGIQRQTAVEEPEEEKILTGKTSVIHGEEPASNDDKKKEEKENGNILVLHDLHTHLERRLPRVVHFRFSEDGKYLAYTTSSDQGEEGEGVFVLDLDTGDTSQILSGVGNYGQVVFSKDGKQLTFLTDRDDYEADAPTWALYRWSQGDDKAQQIAATKTAGIPDGWVISDASTPQFTEDGKFLWFKTMPKRDKKDEQKDDETTDSEEEPKVAKLDIWHWQDPLLQPQQLKSVEQDANRSYRAVYDVSTKKVMQIGSKEIPEVRIDTRNESKFRLGFSPDSYSKYQSWDKEYSDWHLIDISTGKSQLFMTKGWGKPSLSPSGKYVTWWDGEKKTWFAVATSFLTDESQQHKPVGIGQGIGSPLYNELHDEPTLPNSYGSAGWLADDEAFLVYDRWDIWQVDPTGEKAPVCVTQGIGREKSIRFRLIRLDREAKAIDLEESQVLSAFSHVTKASGYYRMQRSDKAGYDLQPLILLDEYVTGLRKSRDAKRVLFTRQSFYRFPDLWASNLKFKSLRRISKANPQQQDFIWGTSELVSWTADDGAELEGLLYKPENFDKRQKHPLLVYFYERYSDKLHHYYNPKPSRSSINISFYVSRGYVVFVPDVTYRKGEPGASAANAVLSGVRHVVSDGYVDETRIGMQGHSWGGYQTAYLTTVTDMFCCAESGAPVSNMTSAYGGIRWGTGKSRMFQYEQEQSRIGASLWDAREKYIANSPLFFADKINTPMLILHNDRDTAVPWYQGIELFVALRRLEKPVWMLNYNGEEHWVNKEVNRMDFTKRMQQFFDHYLKGDPMPVWMSQGIPAVDKGKNLGFEYAE